MSTRKTEKDLNEYMANLSAQNYKSKMNLTLTTALLKCFVAAGCPSEWHEEITAWARIEWGDDVTLFFKKDSVVVENFKTGLYKEISYKDFQKKG